MATAELGAGSYGSCYAGEAPDGRAVALKVSSCYGSEGRRFEDYYREAENMMALQGVPGIPVFLEWLVVDHELVAAFVQVTELFEGTLRGAMESGALTEPLLYRYALDICRALEGMHGRGYLHLDVAPSNIFLRGGRAYLGDLGMARKTAEFRMLRGAEVTTLWYRAPELFGRRPAGESADVWSAGCVVMEMARALYEGKGYPWAARDEDQLLRAISRTVRYGGAQAHVPGAPEKLRLCISRMLTLRPSERSSARAFVLCLGRLCESSVGAARVCGAQEGGGGVE